MKRAILKSVIQPIFFLMVLASLSSGQELEINGYVRTYLGVLTNETMDYSIVQNTLDLKLRHSADQVVFMANPYLYQYPNHSPYLGLREAYMDMYFDNMDIRIGKQQIIWGKADGVFITDIVSPKDLGEFLLRDFEEIRTGTTSLKADYFKGNNTFEFVWIPQFTSTIMPDSTSIWYRAPTFSLPVTIDSTRKDVPGKLKNSEGFLKFSGISSLVDYELIAGSMWDDDPTLHFTTIMAAGNPEPVGLTIVPEHHRLIMGGGSFSTGLGGYILRGEGAYYSGKQFSANNTQGLPFDLTEKDYLHYLVGTDFSLGRTQVSFQFIQQVILNYDATLIQEEIDNTVTLMANHTFLQETLTMQLFTYIGLNNEDALIRPTVTYDLSDGFEIITGANIFIGKNDVADTGVFSYYDENDMIYLKAKYSF
jgi:Protein of unknown function (DUF1302)